jgi:hypothetical protein
MDGQPFFLRLFHSEADKAPSRIKGDVTELCQITRQLDVTFADLPEYTNSAGEQYRVLNFDVGMTYSGAMLKFAVYVAGRRQGEQGVEVSFTSSNGFKTPSKHYGRTSSSYRSKPSPVKLPSC